MAGPEPVSSTAVCQAPRGAGLGSLQGAQTQALSPEVPPLMLTQGDEGYHRGQSIKCRGGGV